MKAEIKNGMLVVSLPVNTKPTPSKSGKTNIVASSHGNKLTALEIGGKAVTIGVNAYVPA